MLRLRHQEQGSAAVTIAASGGGGKFRPLRGDDPCEQPYASRMLGRGKNCSTLGPAVAGQSHLLRIYSIRTQLYITGMSGTTGNGTFDIKGAGTATLGNSIRHSIGIDATAPTSGNANRVWSINITSERHGDKIRLEHRLQ